FGANDASVVVSPSGGVPPYQVFYDNGASDGTMLQAGNHTVEVKDSLGCSVIFPFFVPAYPCDSLGIKAIDLDVQTSCFDKPVTLSIKNISGGQPAYNILWSNGSTDSTVTDTFKNLTSLKVTDAKNCLFTLILDIDQPDSIFVNFEINDATPGNTDGSVLVSATGGQGTFSYLWQDGSTTELLTGLAPGNYCVTITDAAGCSVVKCAEVKLKVSTNDLISQGWKLFPNPAKDFLYLKQAIVDGSQVSWQILDASGTNILTGEQKNTAGTIPVSVAHLPSGQYYLLLHHHSKQLYAKFIIK
ncbi:MAG TPA: T9SS type A sorting domain-containing protein, partial [Saprospiraceae bacterium]|nr:T9SS type A sorting domain-containing protein [Saprospiraceae bacterium]